MSIAAVASWLGHASPTVTLSTYAHMMPVDEDAGPRCHLGGARGSLCHQCVTWAPAARHSPCSVLVAGVGGPVGLEEVPLLGCGADEHLQLGRQELRDARDVVAQGALAARTDTGGRMIGVVTVSLRGEVHRGGQDRRAGPQSEGRRSARQRRALAEELDLDAAALDVPVREQAHDLVGPQRPRGRPAAADGPTGTTVMPSDSAERDEPLEQLRRLQRLDHHGDRQPLIGDPAARPLPPAQVGQGDDDAEAGAERVVDVLEPLVRERGVDLLGRQPGSRKLSTQ